MSALPEGPSGTNGLGPPAPSIRRDRTWPGQSRQACVTWTERTRGSGARAPARRRPCQAKAALCEGGVARIRGRGARTGLLVEDFLFHAAGFAQRRLRTTPPSPGTAFVLRARARRCSLSVRSRPRRPAEIAQAKSCLGGCWERAGQARSFLTAPGRGRQSLPVPGGQPKPTLVGRRWSRQVD